MSTRQPNLFTRSDTLFGVCEGLGQDIGIHPNLLRIAFGGLVIINLEMAIAVYLGLGLLVLLSRTLFPSRPAAQAVAAPSPVVAEEVEELALAA